MSGAAFSVLLLSWYRRHARDLPWRRAGADPYRIWLSEIMLQQTRAQAVVPYYERFLARFPTASALAEASEDEVLTVWSGLGYYSRARNLHRAAREIASNGAFPRDYEALRHLAGVGPYTAAAVASIAFGLPHAVVDGNVLRVAARLENDASDIASPVTRSGLGAVAARLLDRRRPGDFNQALMELGATVCLPRAPRCRTCPVIGYCRAFSAGTAAQLPVKLRKTAPERIEATLAVARRGGRVLLWRRPANSGRMAGFWELPAPEQVPGLRSTGVLGAFRHTITHHHYHFTVMAARVPRTPAGMRWFTQAQLAGLPLSTAATKALAIPQTFTPL
jgi:A/G-specific adenine glycosylase